MKNIIILLALLAAPAAAQEAVHDNTVIVFDASGSMEGQKLVMAKDALKEAVKAIPATTHVGLLEFPGSKWIYPLGPLDSQRLNAAIDGIRAGGGTPLGVHIKLGADALLEHREKQHNYGTYKLLVVTDGEADGGERFTVDEVVPEVRARGLTLDAIGVQMAKRHTLSTKVDRYADAQDFTAFVEAVKLTFAEVPTTDPAAARDAFDAIDGLDPQLGKVVLAAFSTFENHPIGEQPPVRPASSDGSGQPDSGEEAAVNGVLVLMGIAVVVLVAIGALSIALSAGSQRRRRY